MLEIKEKTNNGIEECYILTSTTNKQIKEKTNGVLYNNDIYIVARRINDYEESDIDRVEENIEENMKVENEEI